MSNLRRVMWNGTVRALPLAEQLRATQLAGCEALTLTPSDYVSWLAHSISTRDMRAMAADAGVAITHLDPLVRWTDAWRPELPGDEAFPVDIVGSDVDDFFRMAGALEVQSFTAWAGFSRDRYTRAQIVDTFGNLCRRAATEGLRCDLETGRCPVTADSRLQTSLPRCRRRVALTTAASNSFRRTMTVCRPTRSALPASSVWACSSLTQALKRKGTSHDRRTKPNHLACPNRCGPDDACCLRPRCRFIRRGLVGHPTTCSTSCGVSSSPAPRPISAAAPDVTQPGSMPMVFLRSASMHRKVF
jgi:hypothetical protein